MGMGLFWGVLDGSQIAAAQSVIQKMAPLLYQKISGKSSAAFLCRYISSDIAIDGA
jgi:hypothetical protein